MEGLFFTIIIGVIAAVVGVVVGFLIASKKHESDTAISPALNLGNTEKEQLEIAIASQLDLLANRAARLQQQSNELREELINCGEQLCQLDLRANFESPESLAHSTQPRDWAPKPKDAVGTLSEEYGLKDEPAKSHQG